jgi:hypothetical protein
MKNYLIVIGCILVVVGFFSAFTLPWLFPVEQTFYVGGGQVKWSSPNLTLMYLGFGIVLLGALLGAYWFFGKLTGRF